MTSSAALQLDVSSDEAILIEYLEGDLAQKERQQVEERLAKEPPFRDTLTKLEESWKALDLLETYSTDKELVENTLETVVVDAEQSLTQQMKTVRRRWPWMLIPLLLCIVFVSAVGYGFGKRIAPDKNFFLMVATPIIERLDMYTLIDGDDPEFLPLLAQRRVFLPPLENGEQRDISEYHPIHSQKILESFSIFPYPWEAKRRIDRINNLDDALFNHFYRNYKQFSDFSDDKKFKLLRIHEAIEKSPQRQELLQTLKAYYGWWKTLQSYERSEIRKSSLTVEQRVDRIAALKKRLEQHQNTPTETPLRDDEKNPSLEELAKFLLTLEPYHQELVLDLPPDQVRPYLTNRYRAQFQ